MTSNKPIFRYLQDVEEGWRNALAEVCVICRQLAPGYRFIEVHDDGYDEHHVCEPCLVAGRLAESGLRINDADREALSEQLRQFHPELTEKERALLASERTAEVEQRTPRPSVLNMFCWPAHCGDYVVYHKRVDADEVSRLAAEGGGKAFLASHLDASCGEVDEEFIERVWEDRLKGFMQFYLWRCAHCGEYLFTCTSD